MSTALLTAPPHPRRRRPGAWLARHRGLLIAVIVFAVMFAIVDAITAGPMSYFEVSFMSSGGATLALAAMGQTVVVLTGGFDLSAGAVVSLVNVVLASGMGPDVPSQLLMGLAALAIGAAVGAVNGFFVAFVRLQPIVVTLSTMFIVQGITLLIMDKPGGTIAPEFSALLAGDAIPGVLPSAVVVLLVAATFWLLRSLPSVHLVWGEKSPHNGLFRGPGEITGRAPSTHETNR